MATMLRLLQDVFASGAVSRDRLFGCVTVYVLIGVAVLLLRDRSGAVAGGFHGIGVASKT